MSRVGRIATTAAGVLAPVVVAVLGARRPGARDARRRRRADDDD